METPKQEEGYDYKEALLPPEEQSELNTLRRKQMEAEFTEEERKRFMELQAKEDQARQEKVA